MTEKRILISDICNTVATYLDEEQIKQIYDAYLLAANAHDGQYRKSGEAYVFHPLSVAMILADLKTDYQSIIAAILHDCIEDTTITKEEIAKKFGDEVAHIVDGVSKIDGLQYKTINQKQAQNFRKLLIAASKDIRVLIIKLADRLHNMRTIDAMSKEAQKRIAKETTDIYIPISRRIGLGKITKELKDLSFQVIHPIKYKTLKLKIQGRFEKNQHLLRDAAAMFEKKLQELSITAEIIGRKKNLVSIYQKMRDKKLKFSQVLDLYGIRIIVENINECYQVLGIVHSTCSPIPGSFKDYIALPKSNGYQSLHTAVFGKNRQSIEVQIRTRDMDNIANYGIASHWNYKNNNNNTIPGYIISQNWIQNIHASDDEEFLTHAKAELASDDVFVFTPKGEVIKLPYNSTALDFAYEVHTDIGDRAVRAKIDNINKPLATKISSGQTISVIVADNITANINWLSIATTLRAKTAIKSVLKKNFKTKLIEYGRDTLTDALYYQGIDIKKILLTQYLSELDVDSTDELFIKIALKDILVAKVVSIIAGSSLKQIIDHNIKESQNLAIGFAKCCYPLPKDEVVGVLGIRGLQLHRTECQSIKGEITKIDWHPKQGELFESKIICEISNKTEFAKIISHLHDQLLVGIEIRNNVIDLVLKISSVSSLNKVIKSLNQLPEVKNAYRFFNVYKYH